MKIVAPLALSLVVCQATEAAQAGVSMRVWHAVAAVVTIVVLHRGELAVPPGCAEDGYIGETLLTPT